LLKNTSHTRDVSIYLVRDFMKKGLSYLFFKFFDFAKIQSKLFVENIIFPFFIRSIFHVDRFYWKLVRSVSQPYFSLAYHALKRGNSTSVLK
jgi:hypothetical protein